MAIDWNGLLNAGADWWTANNTANQNTNAAQQYGQNNKYTPYNLSYGNAAVGFNGNSAAASLSPQYQALQQQMMQGAGGFLGGLGASQANGGITPFLQNSFDQYNQQAPGVGDPLNTGTANQLSTNVGDQFNATSGGFLGALGGFKPQDAAASYTNNLRAQAQPGQQRAAEGLAQNLFNTGRLGSTGGQGLYGELVNQQNQQDLGFQLAGQQYGGQEQSRLAGLAQNFGMAGTGINAQYGQMNNQAQNDLFQRQLSNQQNQFNMGNQRAQQRFSNAMSLFGSGQQGQQNQLQSGLGLLGGSQGLDQNLLQSIMVGGQLGGLQSNVNQNAQKPGLDAQVGQNNANGAGLQGLLSQLLGSQSGAGGAGGLIGAGVGGLGKLLDGLFGKGGGSTGNDVMNGLFGGNYDFLGGMNNNISNGLQGGVPGMPDFGGMNDADLGKFWGISDPNFDFTGGFSSAGGEAADGLQQVIPSVSKLPVPGGGSSVPSGGSGLSMPKPSSLLGGGLNIATGLMQGGKEGYGKAAAAGANLASQAGLISGQTGNVVGGLGNLASGNYLGAAKNAAGLLGGAGALAPGGAIASGAAANTALAQAGFSGAAGAGASSGLGASLAASGISTAVPLAALGFAAADILNHAFAGGVSAKRNDAAFMAAFPDAKKINVAFGKSGAGYVSLPDGKLITDKDYQQLAGAYFGAAYAPDGDQEGWMKKYQDLIASTKTATPPKGYTYDPAKKTITRN